MEFVTHVQEFGQRDRWRLARCCVICVARHRHGRESGPALALAHLPAPASSGALSPVRHYPLAGLARSLQVQLLAGQVAPGDDATPVAAWILRCIRSLGTGPAGRVSAATAVLLKFSGCGRGRWRRFTHQRPVIRAIRDERRRRVKRTGGRGLSPSRIRVGATAHAQVRDALDGRLDRVLEQDDLPSRTRALRAHPVTALATREIQFARRAWHVHAADRHASGRRVHAVHVARSARASRVRPITRAVAQPLDVTFLAHALRL